MVPKGLWQRNPIISYIAGTMYCTNVRFDGPDDKNVWKTQKIKTEILRTICILKRHLLSAYHVQVFYVRYH